MPTRFSINYFQARAEVVQTTPAGFVQRSHISKWAQFGHRMGTERHFATTDPNSVSLTSCAGRKKLVGDAGLEPATPAV